MPTNPPVTVKQIVDAIKAHTHLTLDDNIEEVATLTFKVLKRYTTHPNTSLALLPQYVRGQLSLFEPTFEDITVSDFTAFVAQVGSLYRPLDQLEGLFNFLNRYFSNPQEGTLLQFTELAKVISTNYLAGSNSNFDPVTSSSDPIASGRFNQFVKGYMKTLTAHHPTYAIGGFPNVNTFANYISGTLPISPFHIGFAGDSTQKIVAALEMTLKANMLSIGVSGPTGSSPDLTQLITYTEDDAPTSDSYAVATDSGIRYAQTIGTILSQMLTSVRRVGRTQLSYLKTLVPNSGETASLIEQIGYYSNLPVQLGNQTSDGLIALAHQNVEAIHLGEYSEKALQVFAGTLGTQQVTINKELQNQIAYVLGRHGVNITRPTPEGGNELQSALIVEALYHNLTNFYDATATNIQTDLTNGANSYAAKISYATSTADIGDLTQAITYFPVEALLASAASVGTLNSSELPAQLPSHLNDAQHAKLVSAFLLNKNLPTNITNRNQIWRTGYQLVNGSIGTNQSIAPLNLFAGTTPQYFRYFGQLPQASRRKIPRPGGN
ncbi:MAG: hypothetical protein S4CHLAM102_05960 [Chlamydiia bacterium]|nr:hypothetical protein [Chlamydiia bacterium]